MRLPVELLSPCRGGVGKQMPLCLRGAHRLPGAESGRRVDGRSQIKLNIEHVTGGTVDGLVADRAV